MLYQANAWRKRGLSLVPLRWPHTIFNSQHFTVQVAIFEGDGTIAISIGGIEMGQGINTKVAQVVAAKLAVDVGLISVKPGTSFTGNNNSMTGGSMGSDLCCEVRIRV